LALLEQVERARDYASAIIETVRQPLIVLDGELRIEASNGAFYQTFRTSPEETIRSIYEVGGGQFSFPMLRDLFAAALTIRPIWDVAR
jgi:two-component system CheB/CheR fusion protein